MDKAANSPLTKFGERLIAATRETGLITLEGVVFPYRICDPSMQPDLKYFVGLGKHTGIGKELFISADVPAELRKYVFLHEVNCVPHMGKPHHCSNAEKHVFEHVPRPDVEMIADFRLQMFNNLITYLTSLQKPPAVLIAEMRETLEFLKTK